MKKWRKPIRTIAGFLYNQLMGAKSVHRLSCGLLMHVTDRQEFIQRQIIQYGIYEPEIGRIIDAVVKKGDIVIDIGANIGCHTLHCVSRGAIVHAFEPVPHLAKALKANLHLNHCLDKVFLNQVAVSNKEGDAIINVAKRADDGSHSLIAGVEAEKVTKVNVRTLTLDGYLRQKGIPHPSLVKVDVEGAEAWVLDGAISCRKTVPAPIWIIETGDRLAEQIGESANTVLKRFSEEGYLLFNLEEGGTLISVDFTKINGELANYVAVHQSSNHYGQILALI